MEWLPTHYTSSLDENLVTDGDKLINVVEAIWKLPEKHNAGLVLTDWQKWLIRRVLERYPDDHEDPELAGRLRYKQVCISISPRSLTVPR